MTLYLTIVIAFLCGANALRCRQSTRVGLSLQTVASKTTVLRASASDEYKTDVFSFNAIAQKRLCALLLGSFLFTGTSPTLAYAIDPSSLKQYTVTPGAGIDPAQLKKYTEVQDTLDAADIEYTMLKSGTSYREFREGAC
jgi:hypothetical protein